jgi:hypothetical protein
VVVDEGGSVCGEGGRGVVVEEEGKGGGSVEGGDHGKM